MMSPADRPRTQTRETKCFSWRATPPAPETIQMILRKLLQSLSREKTFKRYPHVSVRSALQASTLYKLFESKVVLNVRGTWYFLRGTWYFAQNRMLEVMDGSGEAQKPFF